ncbi:hypothetical protein XENOCAPTIV_007260 [Xenoophorus captivus]|uniref:Uncharacterized protein n=1 Tax=Xenoophorus captivus TaxID=1517983 RepID=A0ABV0S5M5_9TELE
MVPSVQYLPRSRSSRLLLFFKEQLETEDNRTVHVPTHLSLGSLCSVIPLREDRGSFTPADSVTHCPSFVQFFWNITRGQCKSSTVLLSDPHPMHANVLSTLSYILDHQQTSGQSHVSLIRWGGGYKDAATAKFRTTSSACFANCDKLFCMLCKTLQPICHFVSQSSFFSSTSPISIIA